MLKLLRKKTLGPVMESMNIIIVVEEINEKSL
jgi:hypothetical protein